MVVYFILGTKAQLIKMAPLMKEMEVRHIPYRYISTGQHKETITDILDNFGIRSPDFALYKGKDVVSVLAMFFWAMTIVVRSVLKRRVLFASSEGIVLVHGDTFSTLIGAVIGKLNGLKVGHVESGLRSFNIFHPFPEELTRILTFYLSDVFYCPDQVAVDNLRKIRGEKVNTKGNTLIDALAMARASDEIGRVDIPDGHFCIFTIHRFENIRNQLAIKRVVEIALRVAKEYKILFVLHKPTELSLRKHGLYDQLSDEPNIELRPRYNYFDFIALVKAASFLVSDGGSNQEECAYLGCPILLLRKASERMEGLGENCVLSRYDPAVIDDFVARHEEYRRGMMERLSSPSALIVDDLCTRGLV